MVTVLVAGCGGLRSSGPPAQGGSLAQQVSLQGQSYTVGSKTFDEALVLCQIAIAALESVNAEVSDQCNLGGSDATRNALLGGDIDLYWEYTGTAWVSFLGQQPIQDSKVQYEAVKDLDLAQNKIVWLQPTPFNNIYSFALKRERAEQLGLRTLSDMAAYIPSDQPGNMCIESVYLNRDDGFPGLQRTYGFQVPSDRLQVLQTGAIYQATTIRRSACSGRCSSPTAVSTAWLTVLQDDKLYYPLYNAAPHHAQRGLRP
ncbi:MAG TPA: glycine betaine ABC transporter substrate-binding protein [Pseudonocardiaceae bacterium]|nr:glycine betaine ABC transporter substrate-binding protein [Pseudonocardiaceae bacterium]